MRRSCIIRWTSRPTNRNVASMGNRLPVTRLIDELFVDAVLSRLKEVDETIQRRRKLEGKPPPAAGSGPSASSTTADGGRPKKKMEKAVQQGQGAAAVGG